MARQKNAKKGKKRRVPQAKIAWYWDHNHVPNMVRKALRILKHEGRPAADRFVSLHQNSCKACIILDSKFRNAVESV